MIAVPKERLLKRLENLRRSMDEQGFDALLITHPSNRYYVGGLYAKDIELGESAAWLLIGQSKAYGLYGGAHYDEWKIQAEHLEAHTMDGSSARTYTELASGMIADNGWKRIGIDENALCVKWYEDVKSHLPESTTLLPMKGLIEELRNRKDAWEIEHIRQASKITSMAFDTVVGAAKPGITEKELAWRLERTMRENGADGLSFDIIVGAGEWAAVPHHVPIDKKIGEGEAVVVDMGAMVNGYTTDMTRTFCFGDAPERLRQMHAEVKASLDKKIASATVGARPNGHGVGISVHEILWLTPGAPLEAGMTMAIEPAIYVPGWGGVRLEDVVLVADEGAERLTTATMALEFR